MIPPPPPPPRRLPHHSFLLVTLTLTPASPRLPASPAFLVAALSRLVLCESTIVLGVVMLATYRRDWVGVDYDYPLFLGTHVRHIQT